MISCPKYQSEVVRKYGVIDRIIMTKKGKQTVQVQRYQCGNRHVFRAAHGSDWDDSFIERVVFIYLQCLSLNTLAYNFKYTLTHFDYPGMKRDNNLLECFNGILKPRLNLMKSFKKKENLDRYLKLFLTEFRFHPLKESRFKERNGNSPLQIADVYVPPYYNFLRFLRTRLHLSYQLKKP